MSNVHRVGDYSADNNAAYQQGQGRGPPPNQQQPPQQRGGGGFGGMFGAGGGGAGGSMYPPISKVLAPNFDPCTFIFVVTCLQITIFTLELIMGQIYFCGAFVTANDMAGPSTTCMKWMQAKYVPCIQNGEVWRFITPALLHAGILHIFTNMVSQTMVGYTCELWWGAWRMAFFYIAVNIFIITIKQSGTIQ